ncbi:hypothetical protein NESM_000675700 [Novymonas esmeraldas]|uniref:Uncharacterized protein n=1 Tax=Novymonas esmeraldas TaxID=1808958 RepID=A0AAW0ESR9_9TRYP
MHRRTRLLNSPNSAYRIADAKDYIRDAHVVQQLVGFADSHGLGSAVWLSYPFCLRYDLQLRKGAVPVNVWHPLCGQRFHALRTTNQLRGARPSPQLLAAATAGRNIVVMRDSLGELRISEVCASLAYYFDAQKKRFWVPTESTFRVPTDTSKSVQLPPFLPLVHAELLQPNRRLFSILGCLHASPGVA